MNEKDSGVIVMKDYENMTDEELEAEIEKEYGTDWSPKDLDINTPLGAEFLRRVSSGI